MSGSFSVKNGQLRNYTLKFVLWGDKTTIISTFSFLAEKFFTHKFTGSFEGGELDPFVKNRITGKTVLKYVIMNFKKDMIGFITYVQKYALAEHIWTENSFSLNRKLNSLKMTFIKKLHWWTLQRQKVIQLSARHTSYIKKLVIVA